MSKPFVACAVIIDEQNRFLLIKRARGPFEGEWSFISGVGASLKGLQPATAVNDEVEHDIGVNFQGNLAFSYPLAKSEVATIVHVFIGQVKASQINLNPRAASDYKWFSHRELEQLPSLAFDDKWILEQITNRQLVLTV